MAGDILAEFDTGNHDPLAVHLCLRAMEELIRKVKDGIIEQVLAEAEKYGKIFDFHGSQFQITSRRTFDYSGDSVWAELDNSKKKREEMLKHLSAPVADPETGEMIMPAVSKTTQVLSVTLAR
jgi:hypothetical protein